jgi:predicted Na+-dependent transporter
MVSISLWYPTEVTLNPLKRERINRRSPIFSKVTLLCLALIFGKMATKTPSCIKTCLAILCLSNCVIHMLLYLIAYFRAYSFLTHFGADGCFIMFCSHGYPGEKSLWNHEIMNEYNKQRVHK